MYTTVLYLQDWIWIQTHDLWANQAHSNYMQFQCLKTLTLT